MPPDEILLINDGSFLLRMLARRLEEQGYPIWITDAPEQALELLSTRNFDLVVVQLSENDAERLAVLPMVKDLLPAAKLVIVSHSEFLPIEVFETDFDDCISMPCSAMKVWRRLARFLEEPEFSYQRELLLHPANYRIIQRLVANLQEIHQILISEEAGLRALQEQTACQQPMEFATSLDEAYRKNCQSIFLVEKILTNFTGHDFFQDQVDCYDI